MDGLLYREDIEQVRERLSAWWNGGDIGRPVLVITVPRKDPLEEIKEMPKPLDVVCPQYTMRSLAYRVNYGIRSCASRVYLGEAVPAVSPCLGPNCVAAYLGSETKEGEDTVWFEPCIKAPETARFSFDPANRSWVFQLELIKEYLKFSKGKFLINFPDLIEGLDTLSAMRGTEPLLMDLIERPDWVHQCLENITEVYFKYYETIYSLIKDQIGGSQFFVWARGRTSKLQCDFSAMISADMFNEFMVPVLSEMTSRIPYTWYHLDGPAALRHHELILRLSNLLMLDWVPGDNSDPPEHPRWWPIYHKTLDAGKRIHLYFHQFSPDGINQMKKEFGTRLNKFVLQMDLDSPQKGETIFKMFE
ncbi:MAG: hypothetical protein A2Y12_12580 [Planctomycetes bacterium GWF2_42_9]|nr:MAG: hypothetical protein A2Y12_12580 [Planctomycetes bacterium GWF2_42_9]